MNVSLQVNQLTKVYGNKVALSCFNYHFSPGLYGILGANGSGKSTLFQLLVDLLVRDNGDIFWNGKDILKLGKDYRKQVGYMPQSNSFYSNMSIQEYLFYVGSLKGIPKDKLRQQIFQLLAIVDLKDVSLKKMKSLSGGMKQRAVLAQALLGEPKLLLLDEPTAGVDPYERIKIRSHIASIAQKRIVLLATHIVSDIECIASKVLLLRDGKIVAHGTPSELIDSIRGKVSEKVCSLEEANHVQQLYGAGKLMQFQQGITLRMVGDYIPPGFSIVERDIGLEEVYLYYCISQSHAVRNG